MASAGPCCPTGGTGTLAEAEATEVAGLLAALADPVRLRIYAAIVAAGEICACDLEGPSGRSQPTVSHHTARLARAGLIAGERRGRWTWWTADPRRAAHLASALADVLPSPPGDHRPATAERRPIARRADGLTG